MPIMIQCPNCGRRPYTEFWFEGELPDTREVGIDPADEEALRKEYERIWLPKNTMGLQSERWFHFAGCRRLMTVQRDTRTNEIHAVS